MIKIRSKAHFCKIENLKSIITLEAFQMLCRDLYLPFTAVLTVAGLSQRKGHFGFSNFHHTWRILNQDLPSSYRQRISYSIIRSKRSRAWYKWFKKGPSWKQMFFSTLPEPLPVRCEYQIFFQSSEYKLDYLVLKEPSMSSDILPPIETPKSILKTAKSNTTNSDQSLTTENEPVEVSLWISDNLNW